MKKRIFFHGIAIFSAIFLIVGLPSLFLRPGGKNFYGWSEIIGLEFMLLGLLLRISSRGYKADNSKNGNALVKAGPYYLVRNPMYLGVLLIGSGACFLLFKWWVFFAFIAFFLFEYVTLILKEEKMLQEYFGEEYLDYQKKVPRIFPGFHSLFKTDIRSYLPLRRIWIQRELSSVILLPLLILSLVYWQDFKVGGRLVAVQHFIGSIEVIVLFVLLTVFLAKNHESVSRPN